MDDATMAAYRRTTFAADTPHGRMGLRVDRPAADLDALLAERGVHSWAYVTACNPGSALLTEPENCRRQEELERQVRETGRVFFHGEGIGDDGRWPPEPSLLILGIGRAEAVDLGRRFGQRAIVYGEAGGSPQLLGCAGGGMDGK
jgi:hypothetical protein